MTTDRRRQQEHEPDRRAADDVGNERRRPILASCNEPNEWHFHGGTPESPLVHVAINGGGDAIWGDPVTDEEYEEGF